MNPVLEIRDLSTQIRLTRSVVQAVGDVDLSVARGETLGIVGESGCGKSMTGLSVMGLLPPGGTVVGGSVRLDGRELVGLPEAEMRRIRGNEVAMIFQDPLTSLDPTKSIGYQVAEPLRLHRGAGKREAADRAAEMLSLVGLPRPAERLADYPHQLSGGQRQRVMIAMALVCEPKVLIADEPTTALDVTIQAQILALLDDLKQRLGMAMLLITHDMGVIAGHADRVNVMYAGRVVETAAAGELFTRMRHPYTQALLASIPRLSQDSGRELDAILGLPPDLASLPPGCRFAPRCTRATGRCRREEPPLAGPEPGHLFSCWHPVGGPLLSATARIAEKVPGPANGERAGGAAAAGGDGGPLLEARGLVKEFPVGGGAVLRRASATVKAVSGVSFAVQPGQTLGLVGESGCGKTTIGRMVVALERADAGSVLLRGTDVSRLRGGELRRARRDLQIMFQDPYSSLNPRMRVGAIIREPLAVQGLGSPREQRERVFELLGEVGLPRTAVERYPHEFSGGQRQRIGLARALTLNPGLIVADEPVSALDVSIRAQVLNLMKRLQTAHGLTYIVISHDLAVVKYMADQIGVMYLGKLVERGSSQDIYERAAHPYTGGLLSAVPVPDPAATRGAGEAGAGTGGTGTVSIGGELPSAVRPPSGCRFRTRCRFAQDVCAAEEPELRPFGPGHVAACHFPLRSPVAAAPDPAPARAPDLRLGPSAGAAWGDCLPERRPGADTPIYGSVVARGAHDTGFRPRVR